MNADMFRDLTQINWQLLFVRTYTFVRTLLEVVTKQTVKSTKYLANSFADDVYYVYEGSYIPVPARDVKSGLGSATWTYKYNRDTKTLTSLTGSTAGHRSHVSNILEAKLLLGDLQMYDLTDFFDTVEFVSATTTDFPPILTWIGLWSLESGVFLDQTKKFLLSVEMLDGQKFSFPIWDVETATLSKWRAMNAPLVMHRQPELNPSEEECCGDECDCAEQSNAGTVAPAATPVIELPAPYEAVERQETTLLPSPVAAPASEN